MPTETIVIQTGQIVRDREGQEIGSVGEVWPYVPTRYADGPPTPGQTPPTRDEVGYFRIDRGGHLGVGTAHFYVPFQAVQASGAGQGITLHDSRQECEERYRRQPWFVHRDAG